MSIKFIVFDTAVITINADNCYIAVWRKALQAYNYQIKLAACL